MAQTSKLPEVKTGLEHAVWHGIDVWFAPGSSARARRAAARIGEACAWLDATMGARPSARILVPDVQTWPAHATFPVYGMPHYTDPHTIVIAAGPAPFLSDVADQVMAAASDGDKARMAAAYGAPPDAMRFFDLLAVHELGHLYHFTRELTFSQGWLSELHCNLLLHGFVASRDPAELQQLTVLPDIGARIPAAAMRHQRLEAMHQGVDLDPVNYGWFQMNLHALAARMWDDGGDGALRRLEDQLGQGQTVTTRRLQDASPLLADFHSHWPAWR